jgi:hypothetical protein
MPRMRDAFAVSDLGAVAGRETCFLRQDAWGEAGESGEDEAAEL